MNRHHVSNYEFDLQYHRAKMTPFQLSLLADARLESFHSQRRCSRLIAVAIAGALIVGLCFLL